ncbi:MAG: hypothetical protein ACI86H_000308 [bacterium]|jgi:hypothetical protein
MYEWMMVKEELHEVTTAKKTQHNELSLFGKAVKKKKINLFFLRIESS